MAPKFISGLPGPTSLPCSRPWPTERQPSRAPSANAASVWFPSVGGWDGDTRDCPGRHVWKMTEPASAWVPKSRSADSLRASHTENLPPAGGLEGLLRHLPPGTALHAARHALVHASGSPESGEMPVQHCPAGETPITRPATACLSLHTEPALPRGAGSQTQPHAAAGPRAQPPGSTGFFGAGEPPRHCPQSS